MVEQLTNYGVGCVSGSAATCCVQPIDMVKVRVQIAGERGQSTNPLTIFKDLLKKEGPFAFYKGIDAAISRQIVYGGIRLGLFKSLSDYTSKTYFDGKANPLLVKLLNGSIAGGVGSFVGNPIELALIRMQGDSIAPPAQRKG